MAHHTFDASQADKLEDAARRYRYLSAEELLWALDISPSDTVVDLGSGTGFYTDVVAPHAGIVHAVDVQQAMQDYYHEKGVPANVELQTTVVSDLPFDDDSLDAGFSTMTYHEFASEAALQELQRVLKPGARLVVVDWAASGTGESGPPLSERYDLAQATNALEKEGFQIVHEARRPETFLLVGTAR